jgi:5-oxoprolinase (ATP-hydrolysing)
MQTLARAVSEQTGRAASAESVAAGFVQVAVANMANAVKKISVQKGHDVTEYALTTFGGAGGQHACAVADALGIETVLVPPFAGVLSALGIGLADVRAMREQSVERALSDTIMPALAELRDDLAADAEAELAADVPASALERVVRVLLRYEGTDTALAVGLSDPTQMRADFEEAYRRTYSFLMSRPLIVEASWSRRSAAPTVPP